MKSPPRLSPTLGGIAAAAFCCVVLASGAASAQVNWKRVGTVTTLTNGQLCKTDGTNVICDSTTPSISASNFVGIGSTLPVTSLDDSQNPDAIALPGGSNAQRPTGAALVNGEIRYNNTGTGTVEAYYNGAWNSLVTSATAGTSTPAAGSTGYVQFNSGGDLAASSNFFWDNTHGRVGIGTTSPAALLQIGSGQITSASSIAAFTGTSAGGAVNGLSLVNSATATNNNEVDLSFHTAGTYSPTGQIRNILINQASSQSSMAFNVYDGSGLNEKMRINYNGNVGIGTTSPAAALDVYGAIDIKEMNGISYPSTDSTAGGSIAIGNGALLEEPSLASTAFGNTAIGYQAIGNSGLTTGAINNTAVGYQALTSLTTGHLNTAVGYGALFSMSANNGSTAVGDAALSRATGAANTSLGMLAGYTVTTGVGNTIIGDSVASATLSTGGSNILIGTSNAVDTPASGTSNFLNIGNVIFATGMTGTVASPAGNVGIGTTSPAGTLDVEGGTASSGSGTNVKVYAQNGQASGNTNGGNIVLMPGTANGTGTAGAVGIGTASIPTGVTANINGTAKVAGTGSEPCTAAQVGSIRYNPTGQYFELCSYP